MSEEISRAEMRKLMLIMDWREYSAPVHMAKDFIKEILSLMSAENIHDVKYMCLDAKYQVKKSWVFLFPDGTDMPAWDNRVHKCFPKMQLMEASHMEVLNNGVQVKCRCEDV